MAYRKHIWRNGEVIKADLLNNMENGIYNEEARALEAEGTLDQKIDNGVTSVTNAIGVERTRATNAEAELTQSIETESTRATTAESNLSSQLTQESTRAQSAERSLRDYVDEKLTSAYKASGSVFFADLPALAASREGHVYNIKDAFTTTSDFVEGPGKDYPVGTNVAIVEKDDESYEEATVTVTDNPSQMGLYELDGTDYIHTEDTSPVSGKTYYELVITTSYLYDVFAGFIDTSDFVTDTDYATGQTAGIVKPDGTTTTVDANGVISSIGGGDVSSEEMADVVNVLGAKNLNSFPYAAPGETTINGVTFIVKPDYSITAVGTANNDIEYVLHDSINEVKNELVIPNGDYILSGCPDGGGLDTYSLIAYYWQSFVYPKIIYCSDIGSGSTFTASGDIYASDCVRLGISIIIKAGTAINAHFKPMLRPRTITDNTYTAYAKKNRESNALTPILNNLGSKNLIRPYYGEQTIDGVTVIVNADGTVSINGANSSSSTIHFIIGKAEFLEPGALYRLSGCPYRAQYSCSVRAYYDETFQGRIYDDYGKGTTFNLSKTSDSLVIAICVEGNSTFDNLVVRPMLRYALIGDETYAPYAKTNRQLTEDVETLQQTTFSDMTGATSSSDGTHGLVPAPLIADRGKFLRGDGAWQNIPNMTGATSTANGASGLVPQPLIANRAQFLRGDGAWATPTIERSYVGMIIHSTTLNTMAKVVAFYGGTTWIQHSGYVLRGATSGVTANSAAKTGGADSVTLNANQMPSHTHTQNAHQHRYGATYQYVAGSGSEWGYTFLKTKNADTGQGDYSTANTTATNQNKGGTTAVNTLPNYKSVYIWERTV